MLVILFSINKVKGQECTGDLGLPIKNIDFGAGTAPYGAPVPETDYIYVSGNPSDGRYTMVRSTNGLNPGWHQNVINHTPNEPNGYMMVVNADLNKGIFYKSTVSGLCPNTTYEFAAWIINILINRGIRPNVKFTIQNDGVTLKDFSTGDILEGTALDWKKYGTTFKTPNDIGVITLIMSNENPGGIGNDLALDDITFRPCGPKITPVIVSTNSTTANICEGQSTTVNLSAAVSPVYIDPAYQWQVNTGSGWTNLNQPDAQSTQVVVTYTDAVAGTYTYQLLVAERVNINSPNCRIVSTPLTVTVNANPTPTASYSGLACEGSSVTLSVNPGATFAWTGPNNFTSTQQNPVLDNLRPAQSGIYKVTVANAAGCTATSEVNLQILPKIIATTNILNGTTTICEEGKVQLIASGGTSYHWEPAIGLSNPNIANPIASPLAATTYTVTVSNGLCSANTSVLVNVTKIAKSDAGADKKALFGRSVELDGKASGDNITYKWTPASYLDDPTKLNPIATPPNDMTYTLTVQSACGISTDEVFVKIYPKIAIQNTFTPNGDGKNDLWNIPALAAFPTHEIRIVNRNGLTVFSNKGSYLPWDGKFNQKNVPVGTYYYTIYLNEDFDTLTGWVFLAR